MKSEDAEYVQYPVTITFKNGSTKEYEDESDLEFNLEDFDSTSSSDCLVTDAKGRELHLVVKLMCVNRLELKAK